MIMILHGVEAAESQAGDEGIGKLPRNRTVKRGAIGTLVEDNKFHTGASDGKHYWLTPPEVMAPLQAEFNFDFDPCPHPVPEGFDGLSCEWGQSNYVNPPFGSIMHNGRKKGMTAWARKAIAEAAQGKTVVLVFPLDKWILMLLKAGAQIRNLGDVRWLSTEEGKPGKGTGRHIAAFVLAGSKSEGTP
jgi:hypothetical protein